MKSLSFILKGFIVIFFCIVCISYIQYADYGYTLNNDEGLYLLFSVHPLTACLTFFNVYLHLVMKTTQHVGALRIFSMFLLYLSAVFFSICCCQFFPGFKKNPVSFFSLVFPVLICISLNFVTFPMTPNYNVFNIAACAIAYGLILLCIQEHFKQRTRALLYLLLGFLIGFMFFNKFTTGVILFFISLWVCTYGKGSRSKKYNFLFFLIGFFSHLLLFFTFLYPFILFVQDCHFLSHLPGYAAGHSMLLVLAQSLIGTLGAIYFSITVYWPAYLIMIIALFVKNRIETSSVKILVSLAFVFYAILLGYNFHGYISTPYLFGRMNHEIYFSLAIMTILVALVYKNQFIFSNDLFLILVLAFLPIINFIGTNCLFSDFAVNLFFLWMPIIFYLTNNVSKKFFKIFSSLFIFAICLVSTSIILLTLKQRFENYHNTIDVRGGRLYVDPGTKEVIKKTDQALKTCGFKKGDYLGGTNQLAIMYVFSGKIPTFKHSLQLDNNMPTVNFINQLKQKKSFKNGLKQNLYLMQYENKMTHDADKPIYITKVNSFMHSIEQMLHNISPQHQMDQFVNANKKNINIPAFDNEKYMNNYKLCATVDINKETAHYYYGNLKVYKLIYN